MSIHKRLMQLLDPHKQGKYLSWTHYDRLINLLMIEGREAENKLKKQVYKQEAEIKTLKETMCLLSLKAQTKPERLRLLGKFQKEWATHINTSGSREQTRPRSTRGSSLNLTNQLYAIDSSMASSSTDHSSGDGVSSPRSRKR